MDEPKTLKASEIMAGVTIKIKIVGVSKFSKIRLFLTKAMLGLVKFISPIKVEIESGN